MALDSTPEKIDKMEHYRLNNPDITLEQEGAKRFTKASYPLNTSHDNRKLLSKFVEIKNLSRLPTYLYLIQRL
jgi:hypothetical protein